MRIRVQRQDGPAAASRVDVFEEAIPAGATVHAALTAIARRPVTVDGRRVQPPAWDAECLEGSCGGCTVRLDGRPVLACTTAIDERPARRREVTLAPLARFPVVRDLVVDRSREDEALLRVEAGAVPDGSAAPESIEGRTRRADLAACIGCGACIEACPETGGGGAFVGAEAIAMNRLARLHPSRDERHERHLAERLMIRGGVADCGNAQVCVEVCPVEVPLLEAIADGSRATSARWLLGWMRR